MYIIKKKNYNKIKFLFSRWIIIIYNLIVIILFILIIFINI